MGLSLQEIQEILSKCLKTAIVFVLDLIVALVSCISHTSSVKDTVKRLFAISNKLITVHWETYYSTIQ